jgi:putative transposase
VLRPAGSLAAGCLPAVGSDQGSQLSSEEWTARLTDLGIAISMDGKGRWMDNGFIERIWRSVKYEEIYLKEHATLIALRSSLRGWFKRYNEWRPHASLGNLTSCVYYDQRVAAALAGALSTA